MDNIHISVVIPAYNAELFICETIESLSKQTIKPNEIIVVDDGSTDSTREQVKNFLAHDIRLISLPENKGVSYARNRGVLEAQGDWILLMDADDVAEANLISRLLEQLLNHQQEANSWVLIHSAYQLMDEEGVLLDGVQRFKQVGPHEILGYEFIRNHVCLSGALVNKAAFMSVGGFNEKLTHAEDWDLWLRLAQVDGFGYIDEPLVRVRRHASNTSKSIQNMLNGEQQVLSQYSLDFIRKAIERRELPYEENQLDYVNLLFRMEYWKEGYQFLETIHASNNETMNKKFFLKGIYFYREKQDDEALYCFKQAVTYDRNDGASLNNLAVCSVLLGNIAESRHFLETALQLFPNYLDALHNLQAIENNHSLNELKLTWRQLRPVLIEYKST